MSIYTGKGDGGETSLPGGDRAAKCHPRIQGYGTLEEAACRLAWLEARPGIPTNYRGQLSSLVKMAMAAAAAVAMEDDAPPPGPGTTQNMEQWINEMTARLPPLTSFILPLGTRSSTEAHLARTDCRRVERVLAQVNAQATVPAWVLAWINRLSDYLFTLARSLAQSGNGSPATGSGAE